MLQLRSPSRYLALRLFSVVLVVAGLSVALAACGSSSSSSSSGSTSGGSETAASSETESSSSGSAEELKIAYFGQESANAYTTAQEKAAKSKADELGVSIDFFDAGLDPTTQRNQIQDATTGGKYNVFIVESVDGSAVTAVSEQAIEKGIKVVAEFIPLGPNPSTLEPQIEGLTSTVGVNFEQSGEELAILSAKACGSLDPCQLAFLSGDSELPLDKARTNGYLAKIKTYPNVELVAQQDAGYEPSTGLSVGQNILSAHPDVNVIAAAGSQALLGAATAVKSAGKQGEIKMIADFAGKADVANLKSGLWYASTVVPPFEMAEKAVEISKEANEGKTVPVEVDAAKLSPIGPYAYKNNIGNYDGEW
jgi:ribose transport system substrate-binding protein